MAALFGVTLLPCLCLGSLTWDTQEIKLRAKTDDKEAVAVYHFANKGTTTVMIKDVSTSCGCATAKLEKRTYAPGESGDIKVIFTIGDRVGEQEKAIYVLTDDPANPQVNLALHVAVPELLQYSPRMLMWRVNTEPEEQVVMVYAMNEWRITSLTFPAPAPEVKVRVVEVDKGTKFEIRGSPVSTAKELSISLPCLATFSDGSTKNLMIYLLVR